MQYNDLVIKQYNEDHLPNLLTFCKLAESQGLVNNSSLKNIKLSNDIGLFLIYLGDKIISMSYVHDFSDYYKDTWRCFTRTATLKEYRNKFIAPSKSLVSCGGINSLSLAAQVDYAFSKGAKKMYFTTNSSTECGYKDSTKMDGLLKKLVKIDPRFDFIEEREIFYVKQSVWRLNYKDIFNLNFPI